MENKFKLEWKESVTLLVACCTAREINAYPNSMYCDIKRQLKPLSRAFGERRHEHTKSCGTVTEVLVRILFYKTLDCKEIIKTLWIHCF